MRTVRRVHLGGYNMADYTELPDTAVGIGGIPSGTTVTALRDNPIAIAEGAVGAPSIEDAALDAGAATTAGIDWVALRVAGQGLGGIGTYGLFIGSDLTTYVQGDTAAGSTLDYANVDGGTTGVSPSGTWMCMGYSLSDGMRVQRTTVWRRVL